MNTNTNEGRFTLYPGVDTVITYNPAKWYPEENGTMPPYYDYTLCYDAEWCPEENVMMPPWEEQASMEEVLEHISASELELMHSAVYWSWFKQANPDWPF